MMVMSCPFCHFLVQETTAYVINDAGAKACLEVGLFKPPVETPSVIVSW